MDDQLRAASAWRITEFGRVLDAYGYHPAPDILSEIVGRTRDAAGYQQRTAGAQPKVEAQVGAILDELAIDRDTAGLMELLLAVHTHAVLRACPQPIPGTITALEEVKAAGGRLILPPTRVLGGEWFADLCVYQPGQLLGSELNRSLSHWNTPAQA